MYYKKYVETERFRPELKPYLHTRIPLQGVLLDIIPLTHKNKQKLIFGSIYATDKGIEIDHLVIITPKIQNLKKFKIYRFTAIVKRYDHNRFIPEVQFIVMAENFCVTQINQTSITQLKHNNHKVYPSNHLSVFLKNKINKLPKQYRKMNKQLIQNLKNNGSREYYMEFITKYIHQNNNRTTTQRRTDHVKYS